MKHNIESIEGRVKAVTPQYLHKLIFLQKSFSCKKCALPMNLEAIFSGQGLVVGCGQLLSEDEWYTQQTSCPRIGS